VACDGVSLETGVNLLVKEKKFPFISSRSNAVFVNIDTTHTTHYLQDRPSSNNTQFQIGELDVCGASFLRRNVYGKIYAADQVLKLPYHSL
jgi:hypothetical protein